MSLRPSLLTSTTYMKAYSAGRAAAERQPAARAWAGGRRRRLARLRHRYACSSSLACIVHSPAALTSAGASSQPAGVMMSLRLSPLTSPAPMP